MQTRKAFRARADHPAGSDKIEKPNDRDRHPTDRNAWDSRPVPPAAADMFALAHAQRPAHALRDLPPCERLVHRLQRSADDLPNGPVGHTFPAEPADVALHPPGRSPHEYGEVLSRYEMECMPHAPGSDQLPLADGRVDLSRREAPDPRPQRDLGRGEHLGLRAAHLPDDRQQRPRRRPRSEMLPGKAERGDLTAAHLGRHVGLDH